ncbi:hypothetical protein CBR_g30924 [Chara braunii]|uniref:Uncharacterized protein n=1 Tax=Chara braunii TaxID=69332 RepID=A0A388LDS8_CHABU|nr:hypothetical protein CBR_g30924 [Chara braunii]|eukprot:GBG80461.1 hypothetical protein CBR_g30924 [Chara braunii]
MAATADNSAHASPKRPVTPPIPVQQADELLLVFLERLQQYSETTAAELRKWEEEEGARQQEIQRQLAEAGAARQQAAAEAAAAARLQQQQVEASQNQARYQATMDLARDEATYARLLRRQHFQETKEQEEPTEEERDKEGTAVLMENLLYTCNWQQRELLAMRQVFIRHETAFKALDKKILTLQVEISTLHAANSQQQTLNSQQQKLNDQLQTDVSMGLAQLSAAASTGSAAVDCSPASAAQAKQLEERINHLVASLGDISKFAGASTVSNQLQTLSDRVDQRPVAAAKEWKMPNFKIEKFDDYHKTDPLQWWMAFNAEADVHHTPAHRQLDALYLQLIGGAQAFMTHMPVTMECTIANLHMKITWEEFETKWKTRFMDCDEAVASNPKFSKARLRRAQCYMQLDRWEEAINDCEILKKEMPGDEEVSKCLFNAQLAMKKHRGEDTSGIHYEGDGIVTIRSSEKYKEMMRSSGTSRFRADPPRAVDGAWASGASWGSAADASSSSFDVDLASDSSSTDIPVMAMPPGSSPDGTSPDGFDLVGVAWIEGDDARWQVADELGQKEAGDHHVRCCKWIVLRSPRKARITITSLHRAPSPVAKQLRKPEEIGTETRMCDFAKLQRRARLKKLWRKSRFDGETHGEDRGEVVPDEGGEARSSSGLEQEDEGEIGSSEEGSLVQSVRVVYSCSIQLSLPDWSQDTGRETLGRGREEQSAGDTREEWDAENSSWPLLVSS